MSKAKLINYAALNEELELILSELQIGSPNIDEAIKKYQRGTEIIEELQNYLKDTENVVKRIKAGLDK